MEVTSEAIRMISTQILIPSKWPQDIKQETNNKISKMQPHDVAGISIIAIGIKQLTQIEIKYFNY